MGVLVYKVYMNENNEDNVGLTEEEKLEAIEISMNILIDRYLESESQNPDHKNGELVLISDSDDGESFQVIIKRNDNRFVAGGIKA